MPTYKTEPLANYRQEFQDIAASLFRQVLPRSGGKAEKGSYSFRMSVSSSETIVKIVIYQRGIGVEMRGELPWRTDGVYVLVRTNGTFGDNLWSDIPWRASRFTHRVVRTDEVALAPNHEEHFAYFPVMAGEGLGEIADFIALLMDRANTLGHALLTQGVAGSPQ